MNATPITLGTVEGQSQQRRHKRIKGIPQSYIRVCKGPGRRLLSTLAPEAGDWILRADDELELAGDPPRALAEGEVLVPRLSRVIELLRTTAHSTLIDCRDGEYACMVFDEDESSLANIVSFSPEEAALRALLFVLAERAAQGLE